MSRWGKKQCDSTRYNLPEARAEAVFSECPTRLRARQGVSNTPHSPS